ncbi:hypothetical protein ACIHEI_07190 [Kitasatospora sp. NPDC051984]|uniref:hypothetical protein n=1 Tax=Kitasatospora sp. NPDC051984 TaxID=3364059 RepID=UPI0037C83A53
MSVPHVVLTHSQYQLLTELALSSLPASAHEPHSALARGLVLQQIRADVPALLWMGLISDAHGALTVTALGAAVFHRAEQEHAENRLADVAAFADALETGSELDHRRIRSALRRLAQGVFSLDEALAYLS